MDDIREGLWIFASAGGGVMEYPQRKKGGVTGNQ